MAADFAYRQGGTRCPGCTQAMAEQPVLDAMVDVCESCGGVFIDPGDGPIADVVTQVHVPDAADEPEADSSLPRTCPRCVVPLGRTIVSDVRLYRCSTCGGTFVPRLMLDAAMWLREEDQEPPPTAIEGLRGWVRYLLGR